MCTKALHQTHTSSSVKLRCVTNDIGWSWRRAPNILCCCTWNGSACYCNVGFAVFFQPRLKIFHSKLSWLLQKNSKYREKPYQTSKKTHRRQQYRRKAKKRRWEIWTVWFESSQWFMHYLMLKWYFYVHRLTRLVLRSRILNSSCRKPTFHGRRLYGLWKTTITTLSTLLW